MSVVDRSLNVLKEIQEQLQASKLQTASYRSTTYAANPDLLRGSQKPKIGLNDSHLNNTTLQSEDELPLRVELQNRAQKTTFQNISPINYASPATIRNIGSIHTEESEKDFGGKNEKRDFSLNVSPYKRKIVNKENLSHLTEKTALRSREMVENLKKLISGEIEAFKKECDGIKKQIDAIRGGKTERQQDEKQNTSRGADISEQTLKSISSKFDKLVTDIEERVQGSTKKGRENFGYFSSKYDNDEEDDYVAAKPQKSSFENKKSRRENEYSFNDKKEENSF